MHAGSKSPESKPASDRPKSLIILGLALIILATLIAYLPAARAGFIWNDNSYVHQNPLLAPPTLSSLLKIWSITPAYRLDGQEFYTSHTEQYYPLVFSTYWLESLLWTNTSPAGFHITNILLHIANALLIWLICRRLNFPWAYLLALLFALHPVHVESVAWITERKNVLSALFYLLAMLAYLRYDHSAQKRFYFLALACFLLALFSKTVTCTLPLVLLLLFWTRRARFSWPHFLRLIPFFVVVPIFAYFTIYLERYRVGAEWQIAFWQRCVIAGRALALQGKFNLAFSSLNWAIKLRPDYPLAHLHLAGIYTQLRRYDQAIVAYKKAISLAQASVLAPDRPRCVKAHSNLAAVYAELGRYSLALYHAQQAFDFARHYNLPHLAGPTELQLRDYRKLAGKD